LEAHLDRKVTIWEHRVAGRLEDYLRWERAEVLRRLKTDPARLFTGRMMKLGTLLRSAVPFG